jgi:mRNA-degrading endonuclease RelE of RelBE toxin-antitoxin system
VRVELAPLSLEIDRPARKQIAKLSVQNAERLLLALENMALTGEGDVKDVGNDFPGDFRLRVGDLRVYFNVEGRTIRVRAIEKRGEAYKRKSRNR